MAVCRTVVLLILFSCCLSLTLEKNRDETPKQLQDDINRMINNNNNNKNPANNNNSDFISWIANASRKEILEAAGGDYISDNCYIPEGRPTCAPQFVIAGSMKCGTTSLHTYLLNHPQVLPLQNTANLNGKEILAMKEIRFFNDPTFSRMLSKKGIDKSLQDYYNLFRPMLPESEMKGRISISGDATPMYVCQTGVAKRTLFGLPYSKVIILVRNPVDRLYSEYWFRLSLHLSGSKNAGARGGFEECIDAEMNVMEYCNVYDVAENILVPGVAEEFADCYKNITSNLIKQGLCKRAEYKHMCSFRSDCTSNAVRNSFYAAQILEWVEMFKERLLVIKSEDFYDNSVVVMNQVTKFLGLEPFNWAPVTENAYNIVNAAPKPNVTLVSNNRNGLFVGASPVDQTSSYPPLDPDIRAKYEKWFDPLNRALARILNEQNFWPTP